MVISCVPVRFFTTETGPPHPPAVLEVPQQDHRVGQVAHVHRGLDRCPKQPLLRDDEDRQHALLAEVGQQLVQLDGQGTALPGIAFR